MRILIFTGYFHPHVGGLEEYVLKLGKALIGKGHKVIVVSPNIPKSENNEIIGGVRVLRLPAFNVSSIFPFIYSSKDIDRGVFADQVDVVITNTRLFHASIIGMRFARKNNLHWIHIEHGSACYESNNTFISLASLVYDWTFGKYLLRRANSVICISSGAKRFVENHSGRSGEIIPNGIYIDNIPRAKIRERVRKIIFVGRLICGKGVQDLFVAFSHLSEKDVTLKIVGDGSYRQNLEKLAKKLRIQERVFFVGHKEKEEVYNLLAESDLFINPSYSEGLPTTILEAGAVGLPVIATDVGGTSDIINDRETGLLVEARSPKEIKKAIESSIVTI